MTDLLTSLIVGDINLITGLILLVIATLLSVVGGAIGGMMLAGKEFGYQFSAMLGGLLAPAGVIPVVILGLVILKVLTN
ncbi:hypothetical protein [Brasilonema sp. UFV-L1]|uniref:hypothetical protein n=1 Tax=Brasilonema sp. UFV-L1 TaxID=2234130 RepID=UPI00145C4CEF|nr:hypothetical protein [Brasilonema sp. UFV-L1]NMG06889.1 hypothetical protein [Brasilonema sp. UFV-L1]